MAPLKHFCRLTGISALLHEAQHGYASVFWRHISIAAVLGSLALMARGDPPMAAIQTTAAQPAIAQETQVKAAYLVKFTQYTTWPAEAFATDKSPLVIGISPGSLTADLEQQARAIAGIRPIEIRAVANQEEAACCHAVFLSRNEESWLSGLRDKAVLTVGDSDRAIERGAVIRFVLEGKNLRYEVSRPAMERAGLKISTDMLRFARKVYNQPTPPR